MLLLAHAVFPVELVNTPARHSSLLLAGIKRMAFGTDFNVDLFLCWTCNKFIATVTRYRCLVVIWMDSFFHLFHLSRYPAWRCQAVDFRSRISPVEWSLSYCKSHSFCRLCEAPLIRRICCILPMLGLSFSSSPFFYLFFLWKICSLDK